MSDQTVNSYWRDIGEVRRFGRYLLTAKLAEGGMAEIYLAKQAGLQGFERDVVVKLMLKHLGADPEFVSMFLDEARLAARLFHPNIVQISDLGETEGQYFISMEYLPGEDLAHIISLNRAKQQPIPISLACKIMVGACEGLGFAHDFRDGGVPLNIVHRDVTPSNILVTYQGMVKVVDFGIAKAEGRLAKTTGGLVKGKWSYMSPEQALGERLDGRSDIFALGLTFFELLTGHRPFKRDNDLAALKAVLQDPIPDPREFRPELPPELAEIVNKALKRDLAERYQSAAELGGALESFLAGTRSATGGSQLAQYMLELFGPERAALKTEVPSLEKLRQMGVKVPELDEASRPATPAPLARPAGFDGPPTKVARTPISVPDGSASPSTGAAAPLAEGRRPVGIYLAIAAALGLALTAVLVVLLRTPQVVVQAPAPAPTVAPVAPAGPAPVATPEPRPVEEPAEPPVPAAPVEPPKVADSGKRPPAPLKRLSGQDIAGRVSRSRAKLLGCFESHREALSAGQGKVVLTFTILSSGSVSQASVESGEVESAALSKCIVQQVKAIKFPRHPDAEVTVSVPFLYKLSQ